MHDILGTVAENQRVKANQQNPQQIQVLAFIFGHIIAIGFLGNDHLMCRSTGCSSNSY
jgi:hypothetical protein